MRRVVILIILIAALLGAGAIWLSARPTVPPPSAQEIALPSRVTSTTPPPLARSTSQEASTTTLPYLLASTSTVHSLGTATATPSIIAVNTSTDVTVAIQITDPALIPNSVNLLQLGASGTQPMILGVMQSAGNGNYVLSHAFTASAAFRGSLRRALSNVVVVNLWNAVSDSNSHFVILFPPGVYNVTDTSTPDNYDLASSPGGVALGGGAPEPGSSEAAVGFDINVFYQSYDVSSTFDVNAYLSAEYPGRLIGTITPTTLDGQPAYRVTFQQEEGGGHPDVIAYHNGLVYEISYNSTSYAASFSDQTGLTAFNTILQHFIFSE